MPRGGQRGPRLDRTPTLEAIAAAESLGCAFIMLGHGRFTLVDKEDAARLQPFTWYHLKARYAGTNVIVGDRKQPVTLHSFLTPTPPGLEVDHANRNTLDNRRTNLRIATKSQQAGNSPKRSSRSKFKGVRKNWNRWNARGMANGVEIWLGSFKTEAEAAIAYNAWASQHFGEFAYLNPV